MKRKMAKDLCCAVCLQVEDSISHVFRDCPNAKRVWIHLIGRERSHEFRTSDVREWMYNNLKGNHENYGQDY